MRGQNTKNILYKKTRIKDPVNAPLKINQANLKIASNLFDENFVFRSDWPIERYHVASLLQAADNYVLQLEKYKEDSEAEEKRIEDILSFLALDKWMKMKKEDKEKRKEIIKNVLQLYGRGIEKKWPQVKKFYGLLTMKELTSAKQKAISLIPIKMQEKEISFKKEYLYIKDKDEIIHIGRELDFSFGSPICGEYFFGKYEYFYQAFIEDNICKNCQVRSKDHGQDAYKSSPSLSYYYDNDLVQKSLLQFLKDNDFRNFDQAKEKTDSLALHQLLKLKDKTTDPKKYEKIVFSQFS